MIILAIILGVSFSAIALVMSWSIWQWRMKRRAYRWHYGRIRAGLERPSNLGYSPTITTCELLSVSLLSPFGQCDAVCKTTCIHAFLAQDAPRNNLIK